MINSFNDREVATITAGLLALQLTDERSSWGFRFALAQLYPDQFSQVEPLDRQEIDKLIEMLNYDTRPPREGDYFDPLRQAESVSNPFNGA